MRSLTDFVFESDNNKKTNKIYSFKEFRKYFYTQETVDVTKYWNMEVDIETNEMFENISKWYVKFGDRKHKFNKSYLGEEIKKKSKKCKSGAKITGFTNGFYIEYPDNKWIIGTEKQLINII